MPELPEVETTRRGLAPHLVNQRIRSVIVRNRALRMRVPQKLGEYVAGATIRKVERRAKYLLIDCGTGTLIVHLGMSGRLWLVDEDIEGAIRLYMAVTREGRGIAPLEAAERLISHRPDIAQEAVREALKSADPMVRAAALEVHRKLKLEPEADIRALLFDASGLVRVRAAEVIAAWAADRARR